MKKRILAVILTLAVVLSLVSITALAVEGNASGSAGTTVFAVGADIPIELTNSDNKSVTISGYMKEGNWYVMDDLVLMYDGIYNRGMGQAHDSSASSWKELTGNGPEITVSSSNGSWIDDKGLQVKANISTSISAVKTLDAMTFDYAFSASNVESVAAKNGSNYMSPISLLGTSVGRVRPDGVVLNYNGFSSGNGLNSVHGVSTSLTNNALHYVAVTSDGNQTRKAYLNGKNHTITLDSITDPDYSVTTVNLNIASNLIPADNSAEKVTIHPCVYGARVYSNALTAEQIAQNQRIDRLRYKSGDYAGVGTVKIGEGGEEILLQEYDFEKNNYSTTLQNVSANATLNIALQNEGTYTLTVQVGNDTSITKKVTVVSEDEYETLKAAEEAIGEIPEDITDENLQTALPTVTAAQKAYNELPTALQALVSETLKTKMDKAVQAIDDLAANSEIKVTLTLEAGEGATVSSNSQEVTYKSGTFTLPVPARANYTFQGWYLSDTQITNTSGESLGQWESLSGATLTAKWAHNSTVQGAVLEVDAADDIYALARILAKQPTSDSDLILTDALKADYAQFGITSGYNSAYASLQTATYQVTGNNIKLTNGEGGDANFQGIPNFAGTFDGNGKTIAVDFTLSGTWTSVNQFGCLFKNLGTATTGATVKDLTLTGSLKTDASGLTCTGGLQDIGVLAGSSTVAVHTLDNITTKVEVDLSISTDSDDTKTCAYIGALVGRMNSDAGSVVKNCVNSGNLTVKFSNITINGGSRLGGLAGHVYPGVTFESCQNTGDVSTAESDTNPTITGGLAGSGSSVVYKNCVQAGDVKSNDCRINVIPGLAEGSTGNVLRLTVTGQAGQVVAYSGGSSQTMTDANKPLTFDIPLNYENGTVENNGFSYDEYLTVNGERLDWYNLTSTELTAKLNTSAAAALTVPFQSEADALVLTTADQLLALQKALNTGDEASINMLYALGGKTPTNMAEARIALQTAYYKLGNDITEDKDEFTGIGNLSYPFSGHFDGQGNTITLSLTTPSDYMGLFGYLAVGANGAPVVENLTLKISVDTTLASISNAYIGGLAGRSASAEITGVQVTMTEMDIDGMATTSIQAGGLFGVGTVDESVSASVTISGPINITAATGNIYAGGAIGSGQVTAPITVTYSDSASFSVENTQSGGNVRAGGLIGYSTGGDIDLRGSKLVNSTDDTLTIITKAPNLNHAAGWIGHLTSATPTEDDRLTVDETTVTEGAFAVDASTGTTTTYAGGLVGFINQSYSLDANNYVNSISVTSTGLAGGLVGGASTGDSAKQLNLTDCLNTAAVTSKGSNAVGGLIGSAAGYQVNLTRAANGGTVSVYSGSNNKGGLLGYLNAAAPVPDTLACTDALYLKTNDIIRAVGNQTTDASGVVSLDTTILTSGTFDTPIEALSASAPAALTVTGDAALSGQSVTFTQAGDSVSATFLWNGEELYTATAKVNQLDMTDSAVTVTGVNSSYVSDDAAANADIQVVYNGALLVKDTDYTVAQDTTNHKFTISFTGNYTGSADASYTVSESTLNVTASGYTGVYDAENHSITVNAPAGANVTYGIEADTWSETKVEVKNAGTTVVYWKAQSGENSVRGSAVISITPAPLTITAENKSIYVGGALPEFTYTVSGLKKDDTLTKEPRLTCDADGSAAGSYAIKASGADAGSNYTITYVGGTLTVSRRSSSSSGSSSTYTVTVDSTKNGTVTVSPKNAGKGTTVTITVKPDSGYELDDLTVTDKNGDTVKLTRKSDTQYTFTMPVSKVTVAASFAKIEEQSSVTFIDVPTSAYYYDAVAWAVENGVTTGTSNTTFSPDVVCTRAQAVTFLWRAAGSPAPKSSVNPFADVSTSAYYYDAVLWAVEQGITVGTSATTFSPDATCTRGQIVTLLYRAAGSPAPASASTSFTDVSTGSYYYDAVLWAVENEVTTGTSDTTFSPDASCTRGQIVTFMYRSAK